MGDLLRNLRAGAALAGGLPLGRFDFRFGLNQVVVLLAVTAGLTVGLQYLNVAAPRQFNPFGLGIATVFLAVFLLAGYLVTVVQREPDSLALLLTSLGASLIVLAVATAAVTWLAPKVLPALPPVLSLAAAWLVIAWWAAIAFRSVRLVYGAKILHGLLLTGLLAGISIAPQFFIPPVQIWYTVQPRYEAARYPRIDIERVYYAQPGLVGEQLAALTPERPKTTDLYFVGFAGYASQDVFRREVQSAAALFADRFGAEGRSISLINNPATLTSNPLANAQNLRAALRGIGTVMNPDEDVLFLFLTSHGDRDGTLSADFWPLEPNDIRPRQLRAMLDDTAIKWRVIVVSACYSGNMIEPLQDAHTLVITASRKDRNSFGCSHEAEWTYFGRAYFDRALREQTSFIEAFETARRSVAEKETAEGLTPSEPQIAIGGSIAEKLREFEGRVRADLSIPEDW